MTSRTKRLREEHCGADRRCELYDDYDDFYPDFRKPDHAASDFDSETVSDHDLGAVGKVED